MAYFLLMHSKTQSVLHHYKKNPYDLKLADIEETSIEIHKFNA